MKTLINVCIVDEEGRFGGPESRITQIASTLNTVENCIKSHVVFPTMDSERFELELSKRSVANYPLNITRLSKEKVILLKYIYRFIPEVILLFKFFLKKKFDLIQVNGSQQFKGAIAAKMAGIPLIWLLEDAMMSKIVKIICRILIRLTASGIIVVGKRVHDFYIKGTLLERLPIVEIHPPVDTSVFNNKKVDLDSKLERFKGKKIITLSGINPTKGLEYFIEMSSELIKKYKTLQFFVAAPNFKSQDKYFQKLLDLFSSSNLNDENFRFLGMIDNVPSFLKSGDIFVYTSISESGPMAVWEAMAMGKPIVTTDVGSVTQYLKNGENAFIVPPKNSKALIQKVEALLENQVLQDKMGSAVRSIAIEKLDVTISAKKYANFYHKILSGN